MSIQEQLTFVAVMCTAGVAALALIYRREYGASLSALMPQNWLRRMRYQGRHWATAQTLRLRAVPA